MPLAANPPLREKPILKLLHYREGPGNTNSDALKLQGNRLIASLALSRPVAVSEKRKDNLESVHNFS